MADKLQIEIGLTGAEEVNQRFKRIEQTAASATQAVVGLTEALGAVAGAATLAAVGAMVRFASAASQLETSLSSLQAVTGQTFQNLSAMQQVFAAGGTSAKEFGSSMAKLSSSIDDVAQKIKAQNALEMLGDKQGKALIAWANDIDAVSQHYAHLGEAVLGVGNRITNGLTTLDTQTKAVLNSLAKVSDSNERWLQLADILKSMSAADAAKIGEKLGLTPEQIATLRQGSQILRGLQEEAKLLGLTLTTSNQEALQQMAQAWNQFTALTTAAMNKIGAAAAPAFTAIVAAANTATIQIAQDFEKMPLEEAIRNLPSRLGPAFTQAFATLSPIIIQGGQALGEALINAFANALTGAGETIIGNLGNEIMQNLQILEQNVEILLAKISSGIASMRSTAAQATGVPFPPAMEGMAAGGMIGGTGTGTSDSNLAWVSRGEHIMPARAVAQPGVLAFLEALRRSGGDLGRVFNGMGRFALGGPIRGFADGGLVGSNVTINFPGVPPIAGLRASAAVIDQLRNAAALAQVRSGGRKPSRYS